MPDHILEVRLDFRHYEERLWDREYGMTLNPPRKLLVPEDSRVCHWNMWVAAETVAQANFDIGHALIGKMKTKGHQLIDDMGYLELHFKENT